MTRADKRANKEDFQLAQITIVHVLTIDSPGFGLTNPMSDKLNQGLLQHVIEQVHIRRDPTADSNHDVVSAGCRLEVQS